MPGEPMKRIFLSFYLFIVVVLLLALFAVVPLVEHFAAAPFRAEFNQYHRELVRGPLFLIWQDLIRHPQEEWPERLRQLQPEFGYPLALTRIDQENFSAAEIGLLQEGDILVSDDYHQFWQIIDRSDYALAIGPFPSPGVSNLLNVWTWGLFLLLLGIAALLWALPFWRHLSRISRTASALGEGQLDARANLPGNSALLPLANTFNQMAERIQQLITAQRELTNAVSHELRTPIARLRFGMEMLVTSPEPQGKDHYINGIHQDLDELDGLINELLTYARYDWKDTELIMQERDVVPWLEEVLDDQRRKISAHLQHEFLINRQFKTSFEPKHLGRAVSNLVQNASRYGNGLVKVTLEQRCEELLIHVDDDGLGIPVADRERIFEPFARLDSSRSRESGGYGLGLAIVKKVMDSHQGRVKITTSPLGGSRFTISWPDRQVE
jgi:signal transduction histidine kinase